MRRAYDVGNNEEIEWTTDDYYEAIEKFIGTTRTDMVFQLIQRLAILDKYDALETYLTRLENGD